MSNVHSVYRSLLRELARSSISTPSSRNQAINANLRNAFLQTISGETNRGKALRSLQNVVTFLRADRTHKALLERYSPLHDLSEEERVRATARRVGLDTPVEYKF